MLHVDACSQIGTEACSAHTHTVHTHQYTHIVLVVFWGCYGGSMRCFDHSGLTCLPLRNRWTVLFTFRDQRVHFLCGFIGTLGLCVCVSVSVCAHWTVLFVASVSWLVNGKSIMVSLYVTFMFLGIILVDSFGKEKNRDLDVETGCLHFLILTPVIHVHFFFFWQIPPS